MKQLNGIWLPDHEEHLKEYANKGPFGDWTYQKHKLDAGLKLCKKFDVAVDVGGHCGIWAKEMTKVFGHVHSFEPIKDHRDCYEKNQKRENWTLHPYALGACPGKASMKTRAGSSGDSWLVEGDSVEVRTLDSFNLAPDFLKIDTEGHELFVLKGAEKTLREHKPAIIVEQKPGHAGRYGLKDTEAVTWLQGLGYKLAGEISGDYLLVL